MPPRPTPSIFHKAKKKIQPQTNVPGLTQARPPPISPAEWSEKNGGAQAPTDIVRAHERWKERQKEAGTSKRADRSNEANTGAAEVQFAQPPIGPSVQEQFRIAIEQVRSGSLDTRDDDEVRVITEMSNPPKFSFGQPASSGGTSGSLFGTANAGNNQNSTPTFGSSTATPFGQNTASTPLGSGSQTPNTANNNTSGGGLFGAIGGSGTATPTTSSQPQKPLFGSSATPSSSGFSFGGQQTSSSSTPAVTASSGLTFANAGSGNVLGASTGNSGGTFSFSNANSSSTPQSSATPAATPAATSGGFFSQLGPAAPSSAQQGGSSLFGRPVSGSNATSGSTTPQGQRQTQSAFSTTPAGNPPFASMFGQNNNTNNSGLSATPASSSASATVNTGTALFGSATPNTASSQPAASGNLFNRPANSSSGLFSQQTSSAAPAAPAATTTSAPGSNLFGSTATTSTPAASQPAATAAPAAGGLFSGLRGSTSNQPATATATSGASTGSNLFSGLAAQPATTPAATAGPGTGLLGGAAAQPTTTAPASTGNTGGLFGGAAPTTTTASSGTGLFGTANTNQPATTTATSNTGLFGATTTNQPTATTAASGGGLFGATTNQPAATTAASGGGLFGAGTNQPPTTTAASGAGGLFGAATTAQPSTTTTAPKTAAIGLGASTSGSAPPAQSRLAQKTMDEILTSWSTSLSLHQKSFQSLAKQVSGWDRMLVENSTRISQLYGRCFQAERDCTEVERQLSNVEHSQVELEALLERYEGEVDRLMDQAGMGDGGSGIGGVDAERERTYKTAENCSSRLNEMGQSLTTMIDEINDASTKLSSTNPNGQAGVRPDDPLSQIVRVLNQHLSQLQSIDSGAAALQGRVAAAQREARNLGQSQGLNGAARSIEDFGRSYLGRN